MTVRSVDGTRHSTVGSSTQVTIACWSPRPRKTSAARSSYACSRWVEPRSDLRRLSRLQHAYLRIGRVLTRMSGERCGRLAEKLRPRALVDRAQRSPMNRYRNSWSKQRQSLRGAQWVQVTRTQARAPAPDGNQSKVQVRDEAGHPVEDVGIPGEVHALGAQDRV